MDGLSPHPDNKKDVTLKLPSELVCQISDRASAMHVSVDAAAVVLLQYGLQVQEQKERELEALVNDFHDSADKGSRDANFEKIGQAVFNK
jgi:hypothetical protein